MPMSPEYEAELRERPFRFEDLPLTNGKRLEPEDWGPIYSKPPKPDRKVSIDRWPTNAPSGQKTAHVDDAKFRAKLRAELAAAAAADRRAWAADDSKAKHARYAAAPKYKPRPARKPHYVLHSGEWKLAA